MPELHISVEGIPRVFGECTDLRLKLQTKKAFLDPCVEGEDSLEFRVQFEIKDGKPRGEMVWDHGDKRKFVYLTWFGVTPLGIKSFRRIKLYFNQFEPWEEGAFVRISGKMPDGSPACSTARLMS